MEKQDSDDEWIGELNEQYREKYKSLSKSGIYTGDKARTYNGDNYVFYMGSEDEIDLEGSFTINQLESLLKHMKKYAK